MKAEKLMKIIGEAEDEYVQSALESRNQKPHRRPLRLVFQAAVAAAILLSLAIAAYATDFFGFRVTESDNHDRSYSSFQDMSRAMEEAGFQIAVKEAFSNGYTFDKVDVCDIRDLDEQGVEERSYTELNILYKSASGHPLLLSASQNMYAVSVSPVTPSQQIGGIDVELHQGNYKIFPLEKVGHLTEEEEAWQKQPGNIIGFGSHAGDGEETKITTLRWVKDGVYYHLMDLDGAEEADTLFSMAEELIGE